MNMLNQMNRAQPVKAEYSNRTRMLSRVVVSVIYRAAHNEALRFESLRRAQLVAEFEGHIDRGGTVGDWIERYSALTNAAEGCDSA